MRADPRTYGVGAGDLVDVVVRGRVARVGPLSLRLLVESDPALGDFGLVDVLIPAEGIRAAARAVPDPGAPHDPCASCGTSRGEHAIAQHAFTEDRGGSGIGVVLFAVAIAVLAVLGFLSVAQEFARQACDDVAGTPAACEPAP